MADAAPKRMTVEEFLQWEDGTDTRYELIDGQPVAMAPVGDPHGTMAGFLATRIGVALQQRPGCFLKMDIGVRSPTRAANYYVPDLLVACGSVDRDRREVSDPVLIVEILSPSTETTDRRQKPPDYRLISSVGEILLIDPRRVYAEVHRRLDAERWLTDLLRDADATLRLETIDLAVKLGELYRDLPVEG
jgi:Uma2 family endonuclease